MVNAYLRSQFSSNHAYKYPQLASGTTSYLSSSQPNRRAPISSYGSDFRNSQMREYQPSTAYFSASNDELSPETQNELQMRAYPDPVFTLQLASEASAESGYIGGFEGVSSSSTNSTNPRTPSRHFGSYAHRRTPSNLSNLSMESGNATQNMDGSDSVFAHQLGPHIVSPQQQRCVKTLGLLGQVLLYARTLIKPFFVLGRPMIMVTALV